MLSATVQASGQAGLSLLTDFRTRPWGCGLAAIGTPMRTIICSAVVLGLVLAAQSGAAPLAVKLQPGPLGHFGDAKSALPLVSGRGLIIMALSFAITVIPIIIVGILAKAKYKLNYLSLCGALAGSMTDPPALAFANSMAGSNLPTMSYATVYPLVMIMRVVSAQIIVLLFM